MRIPSQKIILVLKILWMGLVVVGLVWFLKKNPVTDIIKFAQFPQLFWASLFVLCAHVGVCISQHTAIVANGKSIPWQLNVEIFNLTNLSKYIPVSAMNLAVNAALIRRAGLSTKASAFSLLLVTYWTLLAASCLGMVSLMLMFGVSLPVSLVLCMLVWGVAHVIKFEKWVGINGPYNMARVIGSQLMIWVGYGGAFAIIFQTHYGSISQVVQVACSYILSFGVGILAVFAPAGIGVREGVTGYVLSSSFDIERVIAATLYMRLVILVADIVFGLVAWAIVKLKPHTG